MPTAINDVFNELAELRESTPEEITRLVETNFTRLIANDPWLDKLHGLFLIPANPAPPR